MEDLTGSIEVVCFPETYDRVGELLEADAILEVTGKVDRRNDEAQIIADTVSRDLPEFESRQDQQVPTVAVRLPNTHDVWSDISLMQQVDRILQEHDGDLPVEFHVPRGTHMIRLRSRSRRIEWSSEFQRELESILGESTVTLQEVTTPASQAAD
jgi:DNA polymerase-3 subunit alpha